MPISKQKLFSALKFVVLLTSVVMLYLQLKSRVISFADLHLLLEQILTPKALLYLLLMFLLMLLNWSLESSKWKFLMSGVEEMNFISALKGVLSGLAIGFATPNRVGEFAGKIAYLKNENRANGALLSLVGSSAQLLVTIQAGIVALVTINYFSEIGIFVTPIALVTVLFLSLVWLKSNLFFKWVGRFSWFKKWNQHSNQLSLISEKDMIVVYVLSLARYLVFPIQYFVLFKMLGSSIAFLDCFMMTAISYFFLSIVPTYAIAEIGTRGSMNLLVFSQVNAPFVV